MRRITPPQLGVQFCDYIDPFVRQSVISTILGERFGDMVGLYFQQLVPRSGAKFLASCDILLHQRHISTIFGMTFFSFTLFITVSCFESGYIPFSRCKYISLWVKQAPEAESIAKQWRQHTTPYQRYSYISLPTTYPFFWSVLTLCPCVTDT